MRAPGTGLDRGAPHINRLILYVKEDVIRSDPDAAVPIDRSLVRSEGADEREGALNGGISPLRRRRGAFS